MGSGLWGVGLGRWGLQCFTRGWSKVEKVTLDRPRSEEQEWAGRLPGETVPCQGRQCPHPAVCSTARRKLWLEERELEGELWPIILEVKGSQLKEGLCVLRKYRLLLLSRGVMWCDIFDKITLVAGLRVSCREARVKAPGTTQKAIAVIQVERLEVWREL